MIAATGAVDVLKKAHTDNMTPYPAEHEKCVLLANTQERYAPIELIRLG
jgi:putative selenium-binding protein YdfZ